MDRDAGQPVTELLNRASAGDPAAANEVFSRVYAELKRLASIQRGRLARGQTMQTTAVVNEAYLRLVGRAPLQWKDRSHFFCSAARAMRDLLVEDARRKLSLKRGAGMRQVALPDVADTSRPDEIHSLDLALSRLEREIPEDAQIVLLRYFTGLSMAETAAVLGRPLRTVERRWRFCRAWLARQLGA